MSSLLPLNKKLECNSVRQFNEYGKVRWCRLTRIRRFQTLGSVLSLEKLGQTFFAVILTKTPLLIGFLVYELNCHYKSIWLVQIWKMLQFDWLKIFELDCRRRMQCWWIFDFETDYTNKINNKKNRLFF
jgi:hypothetical protein